MGSPGIKNPCGQTMFADLQATFPRSMIGDETITLHFPYDDGVVTTSGTLTLTRVN